MDLTEIKKKLAEIKKRPGRPPKQVKEIEAAIEKLESKEETMEDGPEHESPKEEVLIEEPKLNIAQENREAAVEEDRSAFNCMPCKGEGLIYPVNKPQGAICSVCHGTGKH